MPIHPPFVCGAAFPGKSESATRTAPTEMFENTNRCGACSKIEPNMSQSPANAFSRANQRVAGQTDKMLNTSTIGPTNLMSARTYPANPMTAGDAISQSPNPAPIRWRSRRPSASGCFLAEGRPIAGHAHHLALSGARLVQCIFFPDIAAQPEIPPSSDPQD